MATSTTTATMLEFEPPSGIVSPPPAVQKAPTAIELDSLTFGTLYNGPQTRTSRYSGGPQSPNDLESNPPSPTSPPAAHARHPPVHAAQSLHSPRANLYRFVNTCMIALAHGLNDSAPGALLPYIEAYYSIDYAAVSLLFVANAVGFISAAPFTDWVQAKLGRAGILGLSQALVAAAYVLVVIRPPFPVVVASFFLSSIGIAWTLAVNNVFVARLANGTTLLGIFHGCYGVGGILGPILATALVSSGRTWTTFYFITLGIVALNAVCAVWTSRGYERSLPEDSGEQQLTPSAQAQGSGASRLRSLLRALNNRTTLLGATFIFAYHGAEVSISGWILSFLLTTRPHPASQSPSLGYVTSGFWIGITLGRFVLSHAAQRLGARLAIVLLTAGCILFQLAVWFVPVIIGEAVAIALVGLLLGPIYAFAVSTFSQLLLQNGSGGQLVSSLAFISAMGSSGGAVAPFMTGLVSQQVGTWVVNPVAVGLFGAMIGVWLMLPRVIKRRE